MKNSALTEGFSCEKLDKENFRIKIEPKPRNGFMKKVTASVIALLSLLMLNSAAYALDVFTAAATGNWNVPGNWTAVHSSGGTSTFPGETAANDTAIITGGFTISLDFNFTTLASLGAITVGGGTAGTLEFPCDVTVGGNRTITVTGDVTVNSNGVIQTSIPGTPTARTHIFAIQGNLSNAGTIDLNSTVTVNRFVTLQFTGANNMVISESGSPTWVIRGVTYNKNTATTIIANQSAGFSAAASAVTAGVAPTFTVGLYYHDNSGTYILNSNLGVNYNVNVGFTIVQGTVRALDNTVALTANRTTTISGQINIYGGAFETGTPASGGFVVAFNHGGTSSDSITSGSITVGGPSLQGSTTIAAGGTFVCTGGTVTLGNLTTGNLTVTGTLTLPSGSTATVFAGGTMTMGNGGRLNLFGGTVSAGLDAGSAGGFGWPNGGANPTLPTVVRIDGGTLNIGDGNAVMTEGGNNLSTSYDSLVIMSGTLNMNGQYTLNDRNAYFAMTGGAFNINPADTFTVGGGASLMNLNRGIVNLTGGTITFKNPLATTGGGVTLRTTTQGDPSAAANISGTAGASTTVNWSTFVFGDGVSTRDGSSQGFDMALNQNAGGSHVYKNFTINNPSGNNRFVQLNAVALSTDGNVTITAGDFRLNGNNTFISVGAGTLTIGAAGTLTIPNTTNGTNNFPSGFATYSIDAASTVLFNGNSAGATGTLVNCPTASGWGNLTISTGGNKTLQGANNTVRGSLTLNAGTLICGANLTMASGSKIIRTNTDASGIMTGAIAGANPYAIEYQGASSKVINASAASTEFSGAGTKTLILNMTNATVTLDATRTLGDSLVINNGSTLADAGFTLDVNKNIFNSGDHTGAGKIVLTGGAGAHDVYGTGSGSFTNLELNDANNATMNADSMTINGTLTLTTGKIDIGDNALIFGGSATVSVSSPGSSKMIQVSGLSSATGITKNFSGTGSFTWPVGVSGEYTPATLNVTQTGASGTITVVAVHDSVPTKTNIGGFAPALVYFWRASSTGFSNLRVKHIYTYDNADSSVLGAVSNWVPGRYSSLTTSWSTEQASNINGASGANTIVFDGNGAGFITTVDGDFTAGQTSPFNDAFGTVTAFFSRHPVGDWNDALSWSNVGYHDSTAASSSPGPNSPVKIQMGDSIYVINTGRTCASLVDSGVLHITSTALTGHNFGTVTGTGKLTIDGATFPGGNYTALLSSTGGTVEWSGGTYTIPNSPTLYRNMLITGAGIKTFFNSGLSISGNVTISGGTKVNLASSAVGNITLTGAAAGGGNLTITGTGDTLRFPNITARTITISGNVTVGSGAAFDVSTSGATVANSLIISGSLINDGTFDMSPGGGRTSKVTFSGTTSASITGTTAAKTNFEQLVVNKGSGVSADTSKILDVNSNVFTISGSAGGPQKPLALLRGTFKLTSQGSSPAVDLSTGGGNFSIPGGTRLWVNGGTVQLSSAGTDGVYMKGSLKVSAGSVNIGTLAAGATNELQYDSTAAFVEVIGTGVLRVGANLRANGGTIFKFTMSGDSVVVGRFSISANDVFQISNNAASNFTMTGGVLDLRRFANNQNIINIGTLVTSTVTGGTVHLFDPSLVSAANAQITTTGGSVPLYNLSIGPANTFTGNISQTAALVIKNNFTLNVNAGGTFRTHNGGANFNLSIGGNFTRTQGNFNNNGTGAAIVTFNGSTGTSPQIISGSITVTNLTLNNTAAGHDTIQLAAGTDLTVGGNWTTTAGKFDAITNKRLVTFTSAAVNQSISGSTTFNNLTINNSFGGTGVTVSSGTLTVDSVLTFTNGILAIGTNALVLNDTLSTAIQGGTRYSGRMIQTNGSAADVGVTKAYPAYAQDFTFPVGTGTIYTPARIFISNAGATPAAGTVTVIPVASAHPNVTGGGSNILDYYWTVSKTGFAADIQDTLVFDYKNATTTGTYATYVGAYFVPFTWQSGTGAPANATVVMADDPTPFANDSTITYANPGPSVLQADYTAGQVAEFGAVTTFYSVANGNWNAAATWSTNGFDTAPTLTTPTASSPIVIGNGRTVSVTGATAITVGSVLFDSHNGSTAGPGILNITGTSVSHSIGTVSGVGTLILNPAAGGAAGGVPQLPTGTYTNFVAKDSGTITYGGVTSFTLPGTLTNYNELVFINSTTKSLNSNITIARDLRVTAGVLRMFGNTMNAVSGTGDSLVLASGAAIQDSGTNTFPTNFGTYAFDVGSRFFYNMDNNQTIGGATYGKLYLTALTGARVKTLAGNITTDSLIVGDRVTLDVSTNNYNITASNHVRLVFNNRSLLTLRNSTVTLNGTAYQTFVTALNPTAVTFNNLTINNAAGVTFLDTNQAITVNGVLSINSGTLSLTGAPSVTPNSWTLAGTVTYPGGTGSIIGDSANLTINGSGALDTLKFNTTGTAYVRTLNNLTINRTGGSGKLTFVAGTNDSLNVAGTLTLTKGIMKMGFGNMLKYKNAAAGIVGGDTTAYVDGKMAIRFPASVDAFREFPVGSGVFYRPIKVRGLSTATPPTVRVEIIPRGATITTAPAEITGTSITRFYRVDLIGGNAFTADTLVLSFRTNSIDSEGVASPDSLRILRSTDSLNWAYIGGAITKSAGYFTLAPAGKDSGTTANIIYGNESSGAGGAYYVIASIAAGNTLPVELAYFKALPVEGKVRLEWRTESEVENAYWFVDRKEITDEELANMSSEGKLGPTQNEYKTVMRIRGQGTKTSATDYVQVDADVQAGMAYAYRLADVAYDGSLKYHDEVVLRTQLPKQFSLKPNYPNPFNPSTTIKYELPLSAKVTLKVYNILGQEIATLADNGTMSAGFHEAVWNGLNKYNQSVASGIYIYRITAAAINGNDRFTQTRKMMLIK